MSNQFSERNRMPKEKRHVYLQHFAPLLEMDNAQGSKIENGIRQLKREQIHFITGALKASENELMTLWLADQMYAVVKNVKLTNEATQVAKKNINLKKRKPYL